MVIQFVDRNYRNHVVEPVQCSLDIKSPNHSQPAYWVAKHYKWWRPCSNAPLIPGGVPTTIPKLLSLTITQYCCSGTHGSLDLLNKNWQLFNLEKKLRTNMFNWMVWGLRFGLNKAQRNYTDWRRNWMAAKCDFWVGCFFCFLYPYLSSGHAPLLDGLGPPHLHHSKILHLHTVC